MRFSGFCVGSILVLCGCHALVLAIATLAGVIVWMLIIFCDMRRVCPKIEFGFHHVSIDRLKSIMVDGFPLLTSQAGSALFLQGYPLVINKALGASAVVSFVTIRTVSRTLLLLNQVIATSSAPEISRSYGRKDWDTYLRMVKVMLSSAVVTGLLTILGMSLIGPWFVGLWTSGKVRIEHLSMFLFSLSIALQGLIAVGGILLFSCNLHHLSSYLLLVITLASLLLAYFTLPVFGFIAVPGVMVVQDIIMAASVIYLCIDRIKIISLRNLVSVLSLSFYWRKMNAVIARFNNK